MTENTGDGTPRDAEPSTPSTPPAPGAPTPPEPVAPDAPRAPAVPATPPAPEAPGAPPAPTAPDGPPSAPSTPEGAYPPPPGYGQPGTAPGYGQPGAPGYGQPGAPGYGEPGTAPGYGQQQPYPDPGTYGYAQQPYGAGPAGGPATSVGDAFSWGWTKFTQNVGAFLLGVLAYLAVIVVVTIILFTVVVGGATAGYDARTGEFSTGAGIGLGFGYLVVLAVFVLLATFMQAGVIRATLDAANGRRVEVGTFFRFDDFGKVLVAALLVGAGAAVGTLLFVLPGLVFAFLAQFTLLFVIDRGLSPVDALKASFSLVSKNLGVVVLLFLGVYAANLVGSAICGVGQLVSLPVGLLATTFVYRRLQEQPVAA